MSIKATLRNALAKTRSVLWDNIEEGSPRFPVNEWEEWEELLLGADLGYPFTQRVLASMKMRSGADVSKEGLRDSLRAALLEVLEVGETQLITTDVFTIVMAIGVNGVGKTATIGKIGGKINASGQRVMFAAADTFRAAAVEQINLWGQQAGVPVVSRGEGSDPAAVVYEAIHKAKAMGTEVLLIDTAGRLHTKHNLMEELKKMKRVGEREAPEACFRTLLILDATTGQNALNQAETFNNAIGVSAIALTKLDSSAKGGIVVRIVGELNIPVAYIGVGERMEDLRRFNASQFVEALLD